MSIGKNLKAARIKKGLTQEDVSNIMGVTRQTIQKYEAGVVTNIPCERLQIMAEIYDVSPADLMGWESPEEHREENDILKFALFGGADDITDAMIEEVRQFAKMVKLREDNK